MIWIICFVLAVASHPCLLINIKVIFIFQVIFCPKRMINILSVSRLQLKKKSAKLQLLLELMLLRMLFSLLRNQGRLPIKQLLKKMVLQNLKVTQQQSITKEMQA
jgi:hypothetical protein